MRTVSNVTVFSLWLCRLAAQAKTSGVCAPQQPTKTLLSPKLDAASPQVRAKGWQVGGEARAAAPSFEHASGAPGRHSDPSRGREPSVRFTPTSLRRTMSTSSTPSTSSTAHPHVRGDHEPSNPSDPSDVGSPRRSWRPPIIPLPRIPPIPFTPPPAPPKPPPAPTT